MRLLCDNQSVVYIINKGTSKAPAMMAEARELWRLCDQADITWRSASRARTGG